MYVRAPSGTRIEVTEERIAEVEEFVRKTIPEHDLELIISEIGVNADWSAAYTPNAGPMDAVVKVQLTERPRARRPRSTSQLLRDRRVARTRGSRPGVRLRRRRHDPRRDERGQVDADQHPGHRQGPGSSRARSPRRSGARSSGSTAWSTPGSSSGSTTPSTSSTSTAPRPPTWA